MKKKINAFDYAGEILTRLKSGILLTTKAGDRVNTMTIAWGAMGIEWARPMFIAYVRESRYSFDLLQENAEFTINVPMGDFDKKILAVAGTKSGRNMDKIKDLNLTLVPGDEVSVPGIKELPLTLECKVIYKQVQDLDAILKEEQERFYPQNVGGECCGNNRDIHTAFYGEIVGAYIIE